MITQSSQKHIHQKSNSNTNIHQIMQTVGDLQSNRNSLNQNMVYSVRNNTSNNDSSNSHSHKFNPFKALCSQQSQRSGGQAFDIQISGKNSSHSNQMNSNGIGVKRNSSQDIIPPYSAKNENFNTQNIKQQQQLNQHQVLLNSNYNNNNIIYGDANENLNQMNLKNHDNQQILQQKTSDSKKNSLIPHHGGSKSLDQHAFKRMGSCPNNPVQGIQLNNQLHQSTNHSSSSNLYSKGQCNLGQNLINSNYNIQNQGQSYQMNRSGLNSNNQTNHTTNVSQNSQMSIQHYLNANKPVNNSSIQNSNNHTRASSNILSDYQSAKHLDYKAIKQQSDYSSNQPYLSNQFENKNLILSQDLDESIEQRIFKESQLQKHNLMQYNQPINSQQNGANTQINNKIKSISNERQRQSKQQNEGKKQNLNLQNQQNQQNIIGFNSNCTNIQNQIGSCDMSIINNSLIQRDISIIKPFNIDISCFSRDQSMFLDANRDLSINNIKDQSSFFHGFNKKPSNCGQNTITSGYDLANPPEQNHFITVEKGEYPTLSHPNLNNSKSLILEGLKDMSINYSKVEEISNFLEQEKEKNAKLEEQLRSKENILKTMKEFQNDLFSNFEQAQAVIKKLSSESNQEKLHAKIQSLQDENKILREQLIKAEEIYELKQKDLTNQINKVKQDKDEIEQSLSQKLDSVMNAMNQFKKHYEERIQKLQQQLASSEKEKNVLEKQKKSKNPLEQQQIDYNTGINYKQIVQQIQQEFDIQKEHEILHKIKLLGDKDIIKLTECLTEMMISFAPEGYFEKKPTLKQIWKWLKEVLKEYMKNTSDLKKAIKYVNAERQQDFIIKLEKMVFENESYYKIIEQMKQYFNLDPHQFSNLYELQLFLEKKINSVNKQFTNNDLPSTQQEYIYTNLTTDSSKI